MNNKILKKICGLFGYRLIDKKFFKNNRLISSQSALSINKILSDNRVPRWQSLVRGNFVPSIPNPNLYINQKDFGTERNKIRNIIDQQRMRNLYGKYKGRSLPALPPEVPQVPRTPPPDLRAFPSAREGTRSLSTPQPNSAGISALRQIELNKLLGI